MGNVISEGLEYIGRIDDDGYIFDKAGNCSARIDESGYIQNRSGDSGIYGKIDEDGTIRDASLNVVGRIQADGYVIIHSKRICQVSSTFIENITPKAWNAGQPSSYSGRQNSNYESSNYEVPSFFSSSFFIKLIAGIILGIVCWVGGIGGPANLLAAPCCVFLLSFMGKIFGWWN